MTKASFLTWNLATLLLKLAKSSHIGTHAMLQSFQNRDKGKFSYLETCHLVAEYILKEYIAKSRSIETHSMLQVLGKTVIKASVLNKKLANLLLKLATSKPMLCCNPVAKL